MARTGLVCIVLLSLVFSGCRSMIRGYPKPTTLQMEAKNVDQLLGDENWIQSYNDEQDSTKKEFIKTLIIDAHLEVIDHRFDEFQRKLHTQGVGFGVGTDWALLAINVATTTIGAGMTKVAFGAASTAILGAKASFDKQVLFSQALPVLLAEMVGQRESIRVRIRVSQQELKSSYTLYAALSDIRKFERAGSISGALHSIAEEAGKKATNARVRLNQLRR